MSCIYPYEIFIGIVFKRKIQSIKIYCKSLDKRKFITLTIYRPLIRISISYNIILQRNRLHIQTTFFMQHHFVDRQPICSDRITIIHIVTTHNARQLWFMILYINTMAHFCENFSSPHQFTKTSYPLFDLLDIPIPFPLPVQCKNYYDHIILFYTSI